jgi:hypothetical protein
MKCFLSLFAQQIASSVVDYPFSGILVNQNIEESQTILQWETERTTINAGTYSISLPSGLASNRQMLLYVSALTECTLTVTTRTYDDTADQTFIAQLEPREPFYAVLHNIKSASITASQSVTFDSFVARVSPTQTTSQTSPNQGIDPGSLPVGGIIALSGCFAAPAGVGYSEAGILPLPSYLQLCDGSTVIDTDSIFYGKVLPNLTGSKVLFGSTTAGVDSQLNLNSTFLTGFGSDWNIFQSLDVNDSYTVKFYMRIK